jgi:hypothetical protein
VHRTIPPRSQHSSLTILNHSLQQTRQNSNEAGAASFVHNPRPAQCRIVPTGLRGRRHRIENVLMLLSGDQSFFTSGAAMRIGATLAGIVGFTKLQTARELSIEVSPEGLHRRRGDRAARRRAAPHPSLAANGRFGSFAPHAVYALQRLMSAAPRKRQLVTEERRVVKGLGCVKTCTREKDAEVFSLSSSPGCGRQRFCFSN